VATAVDPEPAKTSKTVPPGGLAYPIRSSRTLTGFWVGLIVPVRLFGAFSTDSTSRVPVSVQVEGPYPE
jgi:hypothetical protein